MNVTEQAREEQHYREVEAAMLFVEDAGHRLAEASEKLKRDGASANLISAPETAAAAVRADHARLMKSVYWQAPPGAQGELDLSDTEHPGATP